MSTQSPVPAGTSRRARAHTHTHTHSLSLSLSHTHTHTYTSDGWFRRSGRCPRHTPPQQLLFTTPPTHTWLQPTHNTHRAALSKPTSSSLLVRAHHQASHVHPPCAPGLWLPRERCPCPEQLPGQHSPALQGEPRGECGEKRAGIAWVWAMHAHIMGMRVPYPRLIHHLPPAPVHNNNSTGAKPREVIEGGIHALQQVRPPRPKQYPGHSAPRPCHVHRHGLQAYGLCPRGPHSDLGQRRHHPGWQVQDLRGQHAGAWIFLSLFSGAVVLPFFLSQPFLLSLYRSHPLLAFSPSR